MHCLQGYVHAFDVQVCMHCLQGYVYAFDVQVYVYCLQGYVYARSGSACKHIPTQTNTQMNTRTN